jgi:(p)ppGpp synthase/HD superfamily hydrolase
MVQKQSTGLGKKEYHFGKEVKTLFYTPKIQKAIKFAIKVHQLDQNQTRKGKKDPYIIHPLSVGLILAATGAAEDIIVAGILHDIIEDCKPYGSVTTNDIEKEFGKDVARMVNDVTEQDKTLPWSVRKQRVLEHVKDMDNDSLLVKSADVLHNLSDQLADYKIEGEKMWARFSAKKPEQLANYMLLIPAIGKKWPQNPLMLELMQKVEEAKKLWS